MTTVAIIVLGVIAAGEGAVIALQYSQNAAQRAALGNLIASAEATVRSSVRNASAALTGDTSVDAAPAPVTAPPAETVSRAQPARRTTVKATANSRVRQKRAARAASPSDDVPPVPVGLPPATGLLYVNALPWADVSIDGHPAGQTPLGRLQLTAGVHEVRFTHPQLGEQVRQVTINPNASTRLGIDLRR